MDEANSLKIKIKRLEDELFSYRRIGQLLGGILMATLIVMLVVPTVIVWLLIKLFKVVNNLTSPTREMTVDAIRTVCMVCWDMGGIIYDWLDERVDKWRN